MTDHPHKSHEQGATSPGETGRMSPDWHTLQKQFAQMQNQLNDYAAAQAEAVAATRREVEAELAAEREAIQRERIKCQAEHDARLNQLEEARAEVKARSAQLDEQDRQLDDDRQALRAEREKLRERERDLDQRQQQIDQTASAHQKTRREVERERNEVTRRGEQLDEREAALNEREQALNEQRDAVQQEHAYVDELRKEIETRKKQVNLKARQAADQIRESHEKSRQQISARKARLDARAAELEQTRRQLRTRRKRLTRQRELLRQRCEQVHQQAREVEPLRQAAREVVSQREGLNDVQRLLADAENKMINRWATRRGLPATAVVVTCLLLLAVLSYAIAGSFATQTWRADAMVEAVNVPKQTNKLEWLNDQRRLLTSRNTVNRAATSIAQSGYAGDASPEYIKKKLDAGLDLYADAPGRLQIELVGDNRRELQPILAGLVDAYIANAPLTSSELAAGQMAVIRRPTLDPAPLASNRLMLAGVIFSFAVSICAGCFLLLRRSLVGLQSDRVLDVNLDINEQTWQQNVDVINRALPGGLTDDEEFKVKKIIEEDDACSDPIKPIRVAPTPRASRRTTHDVDPLDQPVESDGAVSDDSASNQYKPAA